MALAQLTGSMPRGSQASGWGREWSFITAMADELQDKALIRREPDPADRRQRNIVLTQHASALRAGWSRTLRAATPQQMLDEQQRAPDTAAPAR